jgi:hypothetical protein
MRQRSQAPRPRRTQLKESALSLQQQPTRSQSKNKRRETYRLQFSDQGANAAAEKYLRSLLIVPTYHGYKYDFSCRASIF